MRYFLDCEFIEGGRTIDVISIGIVAEDGREFYGENISCDISKASDWVKANVLPHTGYESLPTVDRDNGSFVIRATHTTLAGLVRAFCDPQKYGKPEFWGYYADYDWVVLCQLHGTMMDLPKGWPMYCRDIKQWCDQLGNPRLPEQGKGEHHALADARWNRLAWQFLAALAAQPEREGQDGG